jgi:hypothetical protein
MLSVNNVAPKVQQQYQALLKQLLEVRKLMREDSNFFTNGERFAFAEPNTRNKICQRHHHQ